MSTATAPAEIEALWNRISQLEAELRFDGKPYPDGMAPFPGRLAGQGFFPGGDGLWRDDSRIKLSSTSPFPVNGIMFLGNDFGTLQSFEKTLRTGYENVLTWRNLKQWFSEKIDAAKRENSAITVVLNAYGRTVAERDDQTDKTGV